MKRQKDEEGGQEWLNTYADMITLVLTFFVLLYSISNVNISKLEEIASAMQRQLGIGYVLVTHNVDEALLLGDRILVLQDGCLAHEETFPRQEAPRDLLSPAFIEAKRSILAAFA